MNFRIVLSGLIAVVAVLSTPAAMYFDRVSSVAGYVLAVVAGFLGGAVSAVLINRHRSQQRRQIIEIVQKEAIRTRRVAPIAA